VHPVGFSLEDCTVMHGQQNTKSGIVSVCLLGRVILRL